MSLAMRKAVAECEAGTGLKSFKESLKKISPSLTAELDFESIKALTVSYHQINIIVNIYIFREKLLGRTMMKSMPPLPF